MTQEFLKKKGAIILRLFYLKNYKQFTQGPTQLRYYLFGKEMVKHVSEHSVIRNELHAYSFDCLLSAVKWRDISHICIG